MCHTKLGRKETQVFVRRLLLASASCSPCLPYPTCVYVPIWCFIQITAKRHLHRPTILKSLSAVDGRLRRIVLIFGSPRTRTDISVIRRSLMWLVLGISTEVSKLRFLTVFSAHAVFPLPAPPSGLPSLREVAWVHHLLH